MWLHVDGAYGAPAALCPAGRAALRGLELADSLVLDPHKWLFAPYDVGCLFVRRPGVLDGAFSMRPEYLADVRPDTAEVNFGDRSLELTRRSRALKLWLMLKVYGAERVRDAIERCIGLAEHAQRLLESDPGWEVVTPAQLGIVTFARPDWSAEEHAAAAAAMASGGYATVTSTVLRDRRPSVCARSIRSRRSRRWRRRSGDSRARCWCTPRSTGVTLLCNLLSARAGKFVTPDRSASAESVLDVRSMAARFDPRTPPDAGPMEPAPFAVEVSRLGDHEIEVAVTGELDLVSASAARGDAQARAARGQRRPARPVQHGLHRLHRPSRDR